MCDIKKYGSTCGKLLYDTTGVKKIRIPLFKCLTHEKQKPNTQNYNLIQWPIEQVLM